MRTLSLKNTWKNLTLVAAGALMATMIAVPLSGSASADSDDDDFVFQPASATITYSIKGSNGEPTVFELVERDGTTVLALYDAPTPVRDFDDDE